LKATVGNVPDDWLADWAAGRTGPGSSTGTPASHWESRWLPSS